MEIEQTEVCSEPVSPTGQYLSNSTLSLSIIGVLESEVPIDDSQTMTLLKDLFLPINPRFSSVMVLNKNGVKRWKKVGMNLEDHINIPTFPAAMPTKFYDECLDNYLSKIALEELPQSKPLWEIHIIKYPTSHAAGNLIFKLHHSLGDGFSLMGALLSCLQRADNPSLPLTFPHIQLHTNTADSKNTSMWRRMTKIFSSINNTVSEFCSSIIRSSLVEDSVSPIRSGQPGVEFLPVTITTMTFSLDDIKQTKTKLGVTINDIITGTVFLGIRLYMEAERKGSGINARSTSLVLLNTRMFGGYKSVQEMVKPDAELPWGNQFAFLSVSIPKLTDVEAIDPLQFVWKARKIIQKKRSSFAVYLTARYLELVRKFRGPEAASRYLYGTLKNTSMGITNVMGPVEKMTLANHPVKGLYFVVTGAPQSIMMGVISYMGTLRVAMLVEKDFINPEKLKSHIQNAFDMILKETSGARSVASSTFSRGKCSLNSP